MRNGNVYRRSAAGPRTKWRDIVGVRDEDGNVMPDRTISDASARADVFLVGVNAAF